jgi:hypothetical protein
VTGFQDIPVPLASSTPLHQLRQPASTVFAPHLPSPLPHRDARPLSAMSPPGVVPPGLLPTSGGHIRLPLAPSLTPGARLPLEPLVGYYSLPGEWVGSLLNASGDANAVVCS